MSNGGMPVVTPSVTVPLPVFKVQFGMVGSGEGTISVSNGGPRPAKFNLIVSHLPSSMPRGRTPSGFYYITSSPLGHSPSKILGAVPARRFLTPQGPAASNKSFWLTIYRKDELVDDHTDVLGGLIKRSGLRAHWGRWSEGCLTFSDKAQYVAFLEKMQHVPPMWVDSKGEWHTKDGPGRIRVYGTIEVP